MDATCLAGIRNRRYQFGMIHDAERLELMTRGLRRTFDASGRMLREKPGRFVRMMARLARTRARLGLEAIARRDLMQAGSLFGWANDALAIAVDYRKHAQFAPDAERARPFIQSCKNPRADAIARLIDGALAVSLRASAEELLRKIEELDGGETIQEIDDDKTIWWRSRNRERGTKFKTFQNRVTGRRKKIASR